MPGVNHGKDDGYQAIARIVRSILHRLEDLERKTKKAQRPKDEEIIPIANSGAMAVGVSTPYPARKGGQVVSVVLLADDVASGSSTFKLQKNGTLVGNTLTLPSGASSAVTYPGSIRFAPGDIVNLECLTAGTGLGNVGGHIALKG